MAEPERLTFVSQGLKLNAWAWGRPDAPPLLLLLHGIRDHARSWDRIAAAFAGDWRVLAPDLRGHGDSEWAKGGVYLTESYIFDLAGFAEALSPFALVGHSLGGNIALRYAALFPQKVRAVIAIEGLSHSPKYVAERAAVPVERRLGEWIARQREIAGRPPRRYASLDEAAARVRAEHPRLAPEFAHHLAAHGVRAGNDGGVSFKFDPALRAFPPVELSAEEARRLRLRVECPVLLLYGGQSWASNPAEDGRAADFRDARLVVLEGGGHWAHHDCLRQFLSEAVNFLHIT